jgi:hypothetical protein
VRFAEAHLVQLTSLIAIRADRRTEWRYRGLSTPLFVRGPAKAQRERLLAEQDGVNPGNGLVRHKRGCLANRMQALTR